MASKNDAKKTNSPNFSTATPLLPPDYRPSADEEFMNDSQLEYFRYKLMKWRQDLLSKSSETLINMKHGVLSQPDLADRATLETDRALELRTRDRGRKLINKIDEALERISDGSYGFCEKTGNPIALGRLEARPIATMTIEAQEDHERAERVHRDERLDT